MERRLREAGNELKRGRAMRTMNINEIESAERENILNETVRAEWEELSDVDLEKMIVRWGLISFSFFRRYEDVR